MIDEKLTEQELKDLAAQVNGLFKIEIMRQRKEHPKWYESLAFLSGQQWIRYNERTNVIDEIPLSTKDKGKARITINRIHAIVERLLAQLTHSRIMWRVAPTTQGESGYLAARAWERWFTYQWQNKKLDQLLRDEVLVWSAVTGRGWLRVLWNPKGGAKKTVRFPVEPEEEDRVGNDEEDEDLLDYFTPELKESFTEEEIPVGDIEFSARSPFNIFVDPQASKWEEATWLLECSYYPVKELNETYPDLDIHADVDPTPVQNFSRRVQRGMDRSNLASTSVIGQNSNGAYIVGAGINGGNNEQDLVMVKELWTKPTEKYPNGRYVMVVNEKVVRCQDNPYGRIPYVPFVWFPRVGSVFCDGLVPRVVPLQKQLNMLYSQLVTNVKLHGNPPWLVHENSKLDLNDITDRAGAIVRHATKPGYQPPTRLAVPNVVSNLAASIELIERQMDELSGMPSANRGINPEGSRSGAMLQVLLNANSELRKPALARYREGLTETGKLVMEITRRFVSEDRLIPVVGRDGQVMVEEFTKRDIENGYDVFVTAGDGYPDDPIARSDFVLGLLKTGLFDTNDPKVRRLFVRSLEFGDIQTLYDNGETYERVRVHDENMSLLKGNQVEVKEYDLHMEHAENHVAFMRSPEAQAVFKASPEIENLFRQHKDIHLDYLGMNKANVPMLPNGVPGIATPGLPGGGVNQGEVGASPLDLLGALQSKSTTAGVTR